MPGPTREPDITNAYHLASVTHYGAPEGQKVLPEKVRRFQGGNKVSFEEWIGIIQMDGQNMKWIDIAFLEGENMAKKPYSGCIWLGYVWECVVWMIRDKNGKADWGFAMNLISLELMLLFHVYSDFSQWPWKLYESGFPYWSFRNQWKCFMKSENHLCLLERSHWCQDRSHWTKDSKADARRNGERIREEWVGLRMCWYLSLLILL